MVLDSVILPGVDPADVMRKSMIFSVGPGFEPLPLQHDLFVGPGFDYLDLIAFLGLLYPWSTSWSNNSR